jgi:hypothetical protein
VKIYPPPASVPGSADPDGNREAAFRQRQAERDEAAKQAAAAATERGQRQENCARARQNLAGLELGRVASVNASGERYFLEETEIAAAKAKARALIGQWCR